jgi:hypothetical protein
MILIKIERKTKQSTYILDLNHLATSRSDELSEMQSDLPKSNPQWRAQNISKPLAIWIDSSQYWSFLRLSSIYREKQNNVISGFTKANHVIRVYGK